MRTVTICNIMSLDGFYEDLDRNPVVLNMDEAFDAYNLERIRAANIVLQGRTSFKGFQLLLTRHYRRTAGSGRSGGQRQQPGAEPDRPCGWVPRGVGPSGA